MIYSFQKNKLAFTLAEILIVISIIGVVAAMTIPALIKNIQQQDLISLNNKAMSVVTSAFKQMANDNGGNIDGSDILSNIGNYIKLAKNCAYTTVDQNSCWHATGVMRRLQSDGTYKSIGNDGATSNALVTLDGMFIRFGSNGPVNCNRGSQLNIQGGVNCSTINYTAGYCGTFLVDLNATRGPNIYGQDIREVNYWSDGYVIFLPNFSSPNHKRWDSATKLQSDSYYDAGGACYDPNLYSSSY